MKEYYTVKNVSNTEFTEKRSRFIGAAFPIKTRDEAEKIIAETKSKYWDAKHNVYAYILRDGNIKRFSDDGEPQGTAGMPVLDVIDKKGLVDVLVIVTRYFGGILLGTGGLVHAYSHSASLAVDESKIICMTPVTECEILCDYSFYGTVQAFLNNQECKEIESEFEDNVKIHFSVKTELIDGFEKDFTELCNGKIKLIRKNQKYLAF